MATARERLTRFYQKYNADKLHEIEGVLERFRGKESQLFNALVKKYGPEPGEDEVFAAPPAAAASAKGKAKALEEVPESQAVKDFNHARLLAFYKRYNPEKVDDVDNVLAKYKGKEAQLFNALVKKYGPEPDDSDEEDDEEDASERKAEAKHEQEEDEDEDEEEDADEEEEKVSAEPKLRTIVYCPVDTFPPEYCEYGPLFNECKPWLAENCPELMLSKYNRTVVELLEVERQIAAGVEGISLEVGGKQVKKKKKKQEEHKKKEDCVVYISKSSRKGRKRLTFVTGLEDFEGVNIKDACKSLGKRFACSSSLSKTNEGQQQIQLQGDCITELMDVLPEMFGVEEAQIVVVDEPQKSKK
jgi:density-regulated protein DRP1